MPSHAGGVYRCEKSSNVPDGISGNSDANVVVKYCEFGTPKYVTYFGVPKALCSGNSGTYGNFRSAASF
jgi:hypothetical protein